jgi:hypothetical protein
LPGDFRTDKHRLKMKSTLLKTLAAASLVATTHAQIPAIQVLGASWKERGVNAPNGDILPNPGTVAAPRAYLILDSSVLTPTPNAATFIEYGERRGNGSIDRYYTIDSDFRAFLADSISGDSGGGRLYGHMHVPVTISTVANPMIPFSGTSFGTDYPRKLSFDQTVFQNGASDSVTGPRIVLAGSSTLRSVMSGSANPVKVSETAIDIASATNELVARLARQGYTRDLVEAPVIVTNPDAVVTLTDGQQKILKVVLSPDSIPGAIPGTSDPVEFDDFAAPTFQWYKNDVLIPGAVTDSYTVTGGASTATNGSGTYKVVVTNEIGSATSTNSVVSAVSPAFATNLPPTATLTGAGFTNLSVVLNPNPVPAATYQWMKSPTGAANSFVAVSPAFGGTNPTLTVIGGETAVAPAVATGAGHYRVDVTTTAGMISSSVCVVTVNPAGTNFVFTTNLPRTRAVALDATAVLTVAINTAPGTPAFGTYQWYRAPLNNPNAFTAITDATAATLTVSGNAANEKGPGIYRVIATTAASVTPTQTATTLDCTVTTAP